MQEPDSLDATISVTSSGVQVVGDIPSIFDTWAMQLAKACGANVHPGFPQPGGLARWLLDSPNVRTPAGCGAVIRCNAAGDMDVRLLLDGAAVAKGVKIFEKLAPMAAMLRPMLGGMLGGV